MVSSAVLVEEEMSKRNKKVSSFLSKSIEV